MEKDVNDIMFKSEYDCIGVVAGKSGDAIVKEVHKWGFRAAIVCGKPGENGFDLADEKIICDLSFHEKILEFFISKGIRNVILGTGHIRAIELGAFLKEKGFTINIDPEISLLCNNKYKLKKEVVKIGIDTPSFFEICKGKSNDWNIVKLQEENKIKYPCVLKSIDDLVPPQLVWYKEALEEEVSTLLQNENSVMVEEYIRGIECTAVMINSDDNVKCIAVIPWNKSEEDRLKGFTIESIKESINENIIRKIKETAEKIIKHINVQGVSRIDMIVEGNKIQFLEINSLVFSGNLEGSQYTINNVRNGINLSKEIVSSAMNKFYRQNDGWSVNRNDEIITFISEKNNLEEKKEKNCNNKYAIISDRGIELKSLDNGKNWYFDYNVLKDIFLYKGELYIERIVKDYIKNDLKIHVTDDELKWVIVFAGFIISQNSDRYLNLLKGYHKKCLDISLRFLNKE